jgi:soluble lytic murein transglycosylase-like protein
MKVDILLAKIIVLTGLCACMLIGAQSIAFAETESTPAVDASPTVAATETAPLPPVEPVVTPPPIPVPVPQKKLTLKERAQLIAIDHKIPPKLFLALVNQESRWNYRAVSRCGAIGLTQIMPYNVKALGYRLARFRTSPVAQLEAGATMLQGLYKRFGSWDLALAAYNAGAGAVRKYAGIPPYKETRNYVRKIMAAVG